MALHLIHTHLTPNAQRPGGNRPGDRISPQFIVAHSTTDPDVPAPDVVAFFDTPRPGMESSVHAVVDWDGVVVCIPWEPGRCERAWGAGKHANDLGIHVEMCETADPNKFQRAFANYCEFLSMVLDAYHWSPGRILGHWEITDLFPADTDHLDPLAYLRSHHMEWWDFVAAVEQRANVDQSAPGTPLPVILPDGRIISGELRGDVTWVQIGGVWAPVRAWGEALGFTVTWVDPSDGGPEVIISH